MARRQMSMCLVWVLFFLSTCHGLGLDFDPNNGGLDSEADFAGEERLILPIFLGGGNGGLNLTQFAALAALAAAALLPALGLAALGLLLWAILSQQTKDSGTGYGGYSSYSSNYRSFDVSNTDWEKLSILDWISVAEETYSKYDPSSLECQKRVVCELFQNANDFGPPAHRFIKYFSYLEYASVLNVPENVKLLTEELLDAAERGKNLRKDCTEVFKDCEFSLREVLNKFGHGIPPFKSDNKV